MNEPRNKAEKDLLLTAAECAVPWQEVAAVARQSHQLPPWQIVRERRATFAAAPQENAKRPGAVTAWANLFVAGDWATTGLPATIESAIRSGNRAAELVEQSQGSS